MLHCQNKKSRVGSFLVGILIAIAAFIVIFMILPIFIGGGNVAAADTLCKFSVLAREKTYTEIRPGIGPVKATVAEFGYPVQCPTSSFDLPDDRNADEKDVKKQFADLVASCWNRYDEGRIKDVFREGSYGQKCQTCYTINLRETSKFKNGISNTDFLQYMFDTPYDKKITSDDDGCRGINGGFCIDSEDSADCKNKLGISIPNPLIDKTNSVCSRKGQTSCCYTDYGCWNKGGICSPTNSQNKPDPDKYRKYEDEQWDCPDNQECYIKNENYYTYGEYIQRFGGDGKFVITTHLIPGDTYAISFGSPTEKCGWCGPAKIGGAIAGAIGGGILAGIGIAAAPFTLGASLTVTAIGVGVVAGTVTGTVLAGATAEQIDQVIADLLREREMNTIYLTTLNQIQKEDACQIIKSV